MYSVAELEDKKYNKVPKVVKLLILATSWMALLALVVFIAWTTQLNPLITAPAVLSAVYVAYAVLYWTMPEIAERLYLCLKNWENN
jgi:hypothetical protein